MRKVPYTFKRGRYMENASITVHGKTIKISAGNLDDLFVYSDKESIYILSINYRLEYCGLEIFNREDGELYGDIFTQDMADDSFAWILESKRMPTIINFLSQYIYA